MRAPTTSRLLLALGALTLAVLAGSLLTSSGTAAAHDAETPPHPRAEGAENGKCPSESELDDHEDCIEGQSKTVFWHQNYWYPKVCLDAGLTNCKHDWTAGDFKSQPDKWHIWALRHTTSSLIDLWDERTNTRLTLREYLAALPEPPDRHPSWEISWCGPNKDTIVPFATKDDADNADCGHRNSPHDYFDHQAVAVTTPTHTVFVDEHNHCDDGTHPADHPDGECPDPEPVCPDGTDHAGKLLTHPDVGGDEDGCNDKCEVKPPTPTVTRAGNDAGGMTPVSWTNGAGKAPCKRTGQELRVSRPGRSPTTVPVPVGQPFADVVAPTEQSTPVTVEVRVQNDNVNTAQRWSDWGDLELRWQDPRPRCPEGTFHAFRLISELPDGECDPKVTGCPVPGTPGLRQTGSTSSTATVGWDEVVVAGEGCEVTLYRVRTTPQRGSSSTSEQGAGDRSTTETVNQRTGTVQVEVQAENKEHTGAWGSITLTPGPVSGRGCDRVPDTPNLREGVQSGSMVTVHWRVRSTGGPYCTLLETEFWVTHDPETYVLGGGVRRRDVGVATYKTGPLTVAVEVRNQHGWSDTGFLDLQPVCSEVPVASVSAFQAREPWVFHPIHSPQPPTPWRQGVQGFWGAQQEDPYCNILGYTVRYEQLVPNPGGGIWRQHGGGSRSASVTRGWWPLSTRNLGAAKVGVTARNEAGGSPWVWATVGLCLGRPSAPAVHADAPGETDTRVHWTVDDTGDGDCPLTSQYYRVTEERTVNRTFVQLDADEREWLEPNPTVLTGTKTVEVRACNKFGCSPWSSVELPAPPTPETCTGPPGAPVLTAGNPWAPHTHPELLPFPLALLGDPLYAQLYGGRLWVTVSWDDVPDGGWTCAITEQDATAINWAYTFHWHAGGGPDGDHPGDPFIGPETRAIGVPLPTSGTTGVWVSARNQFGWGELGSLQLHPFTGVVCAGPPVAPAVAWDPTIDGPKWTKLTSVAEKGGEACEVVRYDTEYQHTGTTFTDNQLAVQPGDTRFDQSPSMWRTIGEPTATTGHITFRVRAVNQHSAGPWTQQQRNLNNPVCPDFSERAGTPLKDLADGETCDTGTEASDTVLPVCAAMYAYVRQPPHYGADLWDVLFAWWDTLTQDDFDEWELNPGLHHEDGLSDTVPL